MLLIYRLAYSALYLIFFQAETYRKIVSNRATNIFGSFKRSGSQNNYNFLQISESKKSRRGNKIVLMDEFLVPQWILVNSILAQAISEKTNSSIATFGFNPRSSFSDSIFKAFLANKHFAIRLKIAKFLQVILDIFHLLLIVEENNHLKSFEIRKIKLGLDIYETILRTGTPTVQIGSPRYLRSVVQGVIALNFYEWLIEAKGLSAVLLSHDAFIGIGLLGKVAHRHGVPVYHANPYEIIRTKGDFEIYKRFLNYPRYFDNLDQDSQEKFLAHAKNDLKLRLAGEVGVGLPHQTLSAFNGEGEYKFASKESRKALIATHCFFDNPHGYDEMIFADFWEWLIFLAENTRNSNLEWFLKPHRDYLPGTLETLQRLVGKFPHLKILPSDTSFQYLKSYNFEVAFTCYGSIGHELPILGIAVVNCSYNPHIAYNFNTHCASKEDILQVLNYLENSRLDIDLDGIYQFYAVHNYLMRPDDFFFPSMTEYQTYVNNPLDFDLCYEFIKPIWPGIAERFNRVIEDYLDQTEPNSTVYFLSAEKIPHD